MGPWPADARVLQWRLSVSPEQQYHGLEGGVSYQLNCRELCWLVQFQQNVSSYSRGVYFLRGNGSGVPRSSSMLNCGQATDCPPHKQKSCNNTCVGAVVSYCAGTSQENPF